APHPKTRQFPPATMISSYSYVSTYQAGSPSCAAAHLSNEGSVPPVPCSGFLLFVHKINDLGRIIDRLSGVEGDFTGQNQIQLFTLDNLLHSCIKTGLGLLKKACLPVLDQVFKPLFQEAKLFSLSLQFRLQAIALGLTQNRTIFFQTILQLLCLCS